MGKRHADDVHESKPEPQPEDPMLQRARELYSEKAGQVVQAFVCDDQALKKVFKQSGIPDPNKVIKQLKKPYSIHKVHPVVRKLGQRLRFRFCPKELGNGGRCFVKLTDVLDNILPAGKAEVENSVAKLHALDRSRFVLHNFEVTRVRNTSPLQLLLRSNMFDVVMQSILRFQSGERMMRSVSDAEPLVMHDQPPEGGPLVLDPDSDVEYKNGEAVLTQPFGYIEPEATRVALSTSDATNANGIVWIDWRAPKSQSTDRYAVLSKEHVLTMAMRANFDEYMINVTAIADVQDKDTYFALLPAETARKVSDDFVQRQQSVVPICDTDRVLFEVCRQIGGTDWLSKRGAGALTEAQFAQTYDVELEFNMRYTLLSTELGDAVITMPSSALPADALENEAELREAVDRQVAEQIDEESAMFDLEKLRLNAED